MKYLTFYCDKCLFKRDLDMLEYKPYKDMLCQQCGAAYVIPKEFIKNNFAFFDIREEVEIDTGLLRSVYLKSMVLFHPDKSMNKDVLVSMNRASAFCNSAFNRLMSFDDRVEHLISVKFPKYEALDSPSDTGFMMRIFSLNEELESCKYLEDCRLFSDRVKGYITKERENIKSDYAHNNIKDMCDSLNKLKFFNRLRKKGEEKIRDML